MVAKTALFFLLIAVQHDQKRELPTVLLEVANVLNTGVPGVNILHAVKVSGESNFYAFVNATNIPALDDLSTSLSKVANVAVLSRPIIDGVTLGRYYGLPDNITVSNNSLSNEKLHFEEITVFQGGKTVHEIEELFRKHIGVLYNLRFAGKLSIEVYKVLESNIFLTLINIPDAAAYDWLVRFFPLNLNHGSYMNVFVKGVEFVSGGV